MGEAGARAWRSRRTSPTPRPSKRWSARSSPATAPSTSGEQRRHRRGHAGKMRADEPHRRGSDPRDVGRRPSRRRWEATQNLDERRGTGCSACTSTGPSTARAPRSGPWSRAARAHRQHLVDRGDLAGSRAAPTIGRQGGHPRLHALGGARGGRRGITVNAIAPGYIETPMTSSIPPLMRQMWIMQTPLKKSESPRTSRWPPSIWRRTRRTSSPARS